MSEGAVCRGAPSDERETDERETRVSTRHFGLRLQLPGGNVSSLGRASFVGPDEVYLTHWQSGAIAVPLLITRFITGPASERDPPAFLARFETRLAGIATGVPRVGVTFTTMPPPSHTRAVQLVHWLSVLAIFALVPTGMVMVRLADHDPTRLLLTRSHVMLGITTAVLTVIRLVLIWKGPRPAPLEMSRVHLLGVKATHVLLYLLVFAILGSGLALLGGGELINYLSGAVETAPDLAPLPPRVAHGNLPIPYVLLVVAHVGGSILHEVRHGGVLRRIGIPRGN